MENPNKRPKPFSSGAIYFFCFVENDLWAISGKGKREQRAGLIRDRADANVAGRGDETADLT